MKKEEITDFLKGIFGVKEKKKTPLVLSVLNDVFPVLVSVIYVVIGAVCSLWHPLWIIFLTIPVYYSLVEAIKHKDANLFFFPGLVLAVYLILGFVGGWWHPGWVIFVAIPAYYTIVAIVKKKNYEPFIDFVVIAAVTVAYLIMGFVKDLWHPGWAIFFTLVLYWSIKESVKKYKRKNGGHICGGSEENKREQTSEGTVTIDPDDIDAD